MAALDARARHPGRELGRRAPRRHRCAARRARRPPRRQARRRSRPSGARPTPRPCATASARPIACCARRSARPATSIPARRRPTPCCCIRSAGLLILLAILFVMFQAVFAWASPLMDADLRRLRLAGRAGRPGAVARAHPQLPEGRRDRRRRQRHRLPAADRDPVLLHPAARRPRLHGARRLPDGPDHGRRRPARPRLHPAALLLRLRHPRHHGDAGDRRPARPADHHPGGAADDLLGAHPGLYPDHLGLHSRPRGLGLHRPAGAGDVRALRRRHRRRADRVVRGQAPVLAHRGGRALHARAARLQDPAGQEPGLRSLGAGACLPQARRHDDPVDDDPDLGAGLLPAAARGRDRARRSTTASPPRSATRSSRSPIRSASTGRSTWR